MRFKSLKVGAKSTFAVLCASVMPMHALAQEVTLKSADGAINISGQLLEHSDTSYKIKTALGELNIASAGIECIGSGCPEVKVVNADVQFAGSDTVGLGMMPLLMAGYASHLGAEASIENTGKHDQVVAALVGEEGFGDDLGSYLVTSTGSGDAFKALLSGSAQVGMASRRIKPAEARELRDAGAGNMISPDQEHIVAVDSLVVVTNSANPVSELSLDQLSGIFSGQITNWAEVGGENAPIVVVTRPDGSGTRSVFENAIFRGSNAQIAPSAKIGNGNVEIADTVNADENAIGYVGYAFQRGNKALPLINECGIRTSADSFSAKTEEYALQRRLYFYTRQDQFDSATEEFINFATSTAADGVIAKSGFIDLSVERREQTVDGARGATLASASPANFEGSVAHDMLRTMQGFDRLSTTFRFRTGSTNLDERAEVDMERLVEFLEGQPEGTKVMFVGFTDSVGAFDANHALSQSRAQRALSVARNYAGERLPNLQFAAAGFGEVAPTACNTSDTGRATNRRVEVWLQNSNG